jgi:hypothetical protein
LASGEIESDGLVRVSRKQKTKIEITARVFCLTVVAFFAVLQARPSERTN